MTIKGKTVLVTGAGGFIGSHLTERLVKEGAKVKAFIHYNSQGNFGNLEFLPKNILDAVEIITGDIQDPFSVQAAVKGCESIFHLAALIGIPYSYIAPQSYVSTNILGTINIMQACRLHGIKKIVHTSTSETYGTALYKPIDELHPMQGQSPYSASKIGADKMAESYHLSFDLPIATIRPFNTFGPRQSARAVIPTIISQVLSSQARIKLGSLSPIRDFTFVHDTVEGFLAVERSEKTIGQVINIGSGNGITIRDLGELILKLTGKTGTVHFEEDTARIRPENSEVLELLCNNKKAAILTDWKPTFSLSDGLKQTITFIEKYLDHYKPEIYNV